MRVAKLTPFGERLDDRVHKAAAKHVNFKLTNARLRLAQEDAERDARELLDQEFGSFTTGDREPVVVVVLNETSRSIQLVFHPRVMAVVSEPIL